MSAPQPPEAGAILARLVPPSVMALRTKWRAWIHASPRRPAPCSQPSSTAVPTRRRRRPSATRRPVGSPPAPPPALREPRRNVTRYDGRSTRARRHPPPVAAARPVRPLRARSPWAPTSRRSGQRAPRGNGEVFTDAKDRSAVPINTIDHNTFQENISNYLQGTPTTSGRGSPATAWAVFRRAAWSPTSATSGRLRDERRLQEVRLGARRQAVLRPHQLLPVAVFYRKSVFERTVGRTDDPRRHHRADQGHAGDGLIPFAFADKDGWAAMGTFDILNMRINGYDFHMALCQGDE